MAEQVYTKPIYKKTIGLGKGWFVVNKDDIGVVRGRYFSKRYDAVLYSRGYNTLCKGKNVVYLEEKFHDLFEEVL